MNVASYGHCTAIDTKSSRMFLVGGKEYYATTMLTGTEVFDMVTRIFSTLGGQLTVGRVSHSCTIMEENDLLIAAGGYTDQWSSVDTAEILDLTVGTWTNAKVMPSALNAWAVGGVMLTWTPTQLYQYELSGNQWIELNDVPIDLTNMNNKFVPIYAEVSSICPWI